MGFKFLEGSTYVEGGDVIARKRRKQVVIMTNSLRKYNSLVVVLSQRTHYDGENGASVA